MMEEVSENPTKPARGRPARTAELPPPKTKGRKGQKTTPPTEAEMLETNSPERMHPDEDETQDHLDDLPNARGSSLSAPAQLAAAVAPPSSRGQRDVDMDMSESSVRRRLGELTKKYDTLEARYRQLQEIGTKEAEKNFDRLKKQTDERAQSKFS
jgi:hypothetical protein